MLPGFVNGHHHVGLTPVQLGSPDMPLELWFVTRMVTRNVNLYLDTLYSAFEMIASGITTVQHIHGWVPGTLNEVRGQCDDVHPRLRGHRHARVLLLRGARPEPPRLPGRRGFVASLPPELQRADAALVRALQASASTTPWRSSRRCMREHNRQEPGEDPARARQPALVLRQGADALSETLAEVPACRCTCTCSRPHIRRNMPGGAAVHGGRVSSTASACSGRT